MTTEIEPATIVPTVFIIRLKSGVDLISEIGPAEKEGHIGLRNPFRPIYTQHSDSGVAIVTLIHWLNFELFENVEVCEIRTDEVLTMAPASKTMVGLYAVSLDSFRKKILDGDFYSKVKQMGDIIGDIVNDAKEPSDSTNVDPKIVPSRKLQ